MNKLICSCFYSLAFFFTSLYAEEPVVIIAADWNHSHSEIVQEILSHQSDLEELAIIYPQLYSADLLLSQIFSGSYEKLKKLTLEHCAIGHLHFQSGFAPELEELSINTSRGSSPADIEGIENFPALKILDIRGTHIFSQRLNNTSLIALEELYVNGQSYFRSSLNAFSPNLKTLHFQSDSTALEDLSLHLLDRLETVDLTATDRSSFLIQIYPIKNDKLLYLGSLLSLKKLSLKDNWIYEDVDFSTLRHLEALDMSYSISMSPHYRENEAGINFDLRQFNGFDALQTLNLSGRKFSSENIEQILYVTLPNLKTLHLDHANIRGAKIASFAPSLKELSLMGANITGGDIAEIVLLQEIETLKVGNKSLTGAILKKLSTLKKLKVLSLATTNMSKADFSELHTSIEELDLNECELSIASFNTLYSQTHLKRLHLKKISNQNITKAMIDELQAALPHCEIIHSQ